MAEQAYLTSHLKDLSTAPLTSQQLAERVLRDAVHRWQESLPEPEATGLSMYKGHAVSNESKTECLTIRSISSSRVSVTCDVDRPETRCTNVFF